MRIILGVVGTLVAIALIATMVVFIVGSDDDNGNSDKPSDNAIDLEDVLTGQLYAKRFNGSWSSDSNVIYKEGTVNTEGKTNPGQTLSYHIFIYNIYITCRTLWR